MTLFSPPQIFRTLSPFLGFCCAFCSPAPVYSLLILKNGFFQSLDFIFSFLLLSFSSSYGSITVLPSVLFLFLFPFHLSYFISCSAQVTWRQSCVFIASLNLSVNFLTLSGTSPSASSTVSPGPWQSVSYPKICS